MTHDNDAIDYTVGLLGEFWKQQPELRLGQLIINAVRPQEPCPEVFYVKDERLRAKLTDFVDKMRNRTD